MKDFKIWGRARVATDTSIRHGQIGTVVELRSGDYPVVLIHTDGQRRAWKPEELAEVTPA